MKNKINLLLVIVLYKQPLWESNSFKTLIKDNFDLPLFIYDNSPLPQHRQDEFGANVKYVSDISNPGLSFANNRAADYAKSMGYNWMLLLDQDTLFPPHIIEEYLKAVEQNPDIKLFVSPMKLDKGLYMSPVKVRFHIARPAKTTPQGIVSLKKYAPIDSGQLINVNALHEVGGYNEKVPIDFCEYQFHRRLLKKYNVFFVLQTPCHQEFSNEIQNAEQKLKRYEIFCKCLKNCEKDGFFDKVAYTYIVFKRALSLVLFSGNIKPLKSFFTIYL